MKLVLAYTKKSCVTGRALVNRLREILPSDLVRRVKDNNKRIIRPNVIIRYGNAQANNPNNCIELNTRSAVANASNKSSMMRLLSSTEGVCPVPATFDFSNLDDFKDAEGYMFIRGSNNEIRYDNQLRSGDKYVSKPVDKTREYRVQVFEGKVVGIYEKVPHEEGTKIYKSHNCRFVKSDPSISRCNAEAQAMCIKAVESMGLLFGGVDIIRERRTKKFFITEVNSSPGLNSVNVNKFAELIKSYIQRRT